MDISIIIPVYNVEKYLENCIDSVLLQDFVGKYEIICINDGSKDNSLKILQSYKNKVTNMVIIDQKNKGLSAARNVGINNSKGEYIMFLDSDDYLKNKNVLSLMYNEVKNNNLDFVLMDFEYDYEDKGRNFRKKRNIAIKNKVMDGKEFFNIGLKTKSIMSVVWNKLYSRKFILENNLFFVEGILYEDEEYTPRAYYLANRVKYLDKVGIMYRQREGSIMSSNQNKDKIIKDQIIIADSLRKFNKQYKSMTLLNLELFKYVDIIRVIDSIDNKNKKYRYKLIIKERKIFSQFLKSNKFKYKIFGIIYFMKYSINIY
ncbi:glycosyltransferase [Clostridium perfringens]|nr:glycosyltransferase [Clostridium perfringens]